MLLITSEFRVKKAVQWGFNPFFAVVCHLYHFILSKVLCISLKLALKILLKLTKIKTNLTWVDF